MTRRQKMSQKFLSKLFKLFSCLGTGREKKIISLSQNISNLIQLLVSVISHCSQISFVDFFGVFIEKTRFEEFEEICEQIQKVQEIQYNDEKEILLMIF